MVTWPLQRYREFFVDIQPLIDGAIYLRLQIALLHKKEILQLQKPLLLGRSGDLYISMRRIRKVA